MKGNCVRGVKITQTVNALAGISQTSQTISQQNSNQYFSRKDKLSISCRNDRMYKCTKWIRWCAFAISSSFLLASRHDVKLDSWTCIETSIMYRWYIYNPSHKIFYQYEFIPLKAEAGCKPLPTLAVMDLSSLLFAWFLFPSPSCWLYARIPEMMSHLARAMVFSFSNMTNLKTFQQENI